MSEEQYEQIGRNVGKLLKRKTTTNKGQWRPARFITSVGSYTNAGLGKLVTRIVEEVSKGGPQTKWD
jgi:hypothetical protein